jgi:hypothetical protein
MLRTGLYFDCSSRLPWLMSRGIPASRKNTPLPASFLCSMWPKGGCPMLSSSAFPTSHFPSEKLLPCPHTPPRYKATFLASASAPAAPGCRAPGLTAHQTGYRISTNSPFIHTSVYGGIPTSSTPWYQYVIVATAISDKACLFTRLETARPVPDFIKKDPSTPRIRKVIEQPGIRSIRAGLKHSDPETHWKGIFRRI